MHHGLLAELETHYMADMPVAVDRDMHDEYVEPQPYLPDAPKLKPSGMLAQTVNQHGLICL